MVPVILQATPLLALALLGTAIGIEGLSPLFSSSDIILLAVLAGIAFAALSIFKDAAGWRAALLFIFAGLLGCILAILSPEISGFAWLDEAFLAALVLALAAVTSSELRIVHRRFRIAIWALSLIYVLGWGGIALGLVAVISQSSWALFGIVVFGLAALTWFAQAKNRVKEVAGLTLAFELYLLGVNLAVAFKILRSAA